MNDIKHLAIIMDGNGRWAKKRNLIRIKGHENGANIVEDITKTCIIKNIQNLTLYAFSTENWKRPKMEVDFLMSLLKKFLTNKRNYFLNNDVKFNTLGDLTPFDNELKQIISSLKEDTKNNKTLNFNLAINYGGRDEISRACKQILLKNEDFSEENIGKNLESFEYGDIDLLIRTGGERRLSNFMLWSASYAELYFTDTLWPDFSKDELISIINKFKNIQRRFGGL